MNKWLIVFALITSLISCKKNDSDIDLRKGLVVNIPLDGSAVETTTSATGTIFKATPTTNRLGIAYKAMQFNAADSAYISFENLSNASFPENIFTIAFWVSFADTNSAMAVISKRNAFGPYEYSIDNHFGKSELKFDNWIESGNTTVYGIDPLEAAIPIVPNTQNIWQHMVYVADGNTLKAYLNGQLQPGIDNRISGNSFGATNTPLVIGNGGGYNKNYYFSGKMDEIKMYNRVLSEKEIKQLSAQ